MQPENKPNVAELPVFNEGFIEFDNKEIPDSYKLSNSIPTFADFASKNQRILDQVLDFHTKNLTVAVCGKYIHFLARKLFREIALKSKSGGGIVDMGTVARSGLCSTIEFQVDVYRIFRNSDDNTILVAFVDGSVIAMSLVQGKLPKVQSFPKAESNVRIKKLAITEDNEILCLSEKGSLMLLKSDAKIPLYDCENFTYDSFSDTLFIVQKGTLFKILKFRSKQHPAEPTQVLSAFTTPTNQVNFMECVEGRLLMICPSEKDKEIFDLHEYYNNRFFKKPDVFLVDMFASDEVKESKAEFAVYKDYSFDFLIFTSTLSATFLLGHVDEGNTFRILFIEDSKLPNVPNDANDNPGFVKGITMINIWLLEKNESTVRRFHKTFKNGNDEPLSIFVPPRVCLFDNLGRVTIRGFENYRPEQTDYSATTKLRENDDSFVVAAGKIELIQQRANPAITGTVNPLSATQNDQKKVVFEGKPVQEVNKFSQPLDTGKSPLSGSLFGKSEKSFPTPAPQTDMFAGLLRGSQGQFDPKTFTNSQDMSKISSEKARSQWLTVNAISVNLSNPQVQTQQHPTPFAAGNTGDSTFFKEKQVPQPNDISLANQTIPSKLQNTQQQENSQMSFNAVSINSYSDKKSIFSTDKNIDLPIEPAKPHLLSNDQNQVNEMANNSKHISFRNLNLFSENAVLGHISDLRNNQNLHALPATKLPASENPQNRPKSQRIANPTKENLIQLLASHTLGNTFSLINELCEAKIPSIKPILDYVKSSKQMLAELDEQESTLVQKTAALERINGYLKLGVLDLYHQKLSVFESNQVVEDLKKALEDAPKKLQTLTFFFQKMAKLKSFVYQPATELAKAAQKEKSPADKPKLAIQTRPIVSPMSLIKSIEAEQKGKPNGEKLQILTANNKQQKFHKCGVVSSKAEFAELTKDVETVQSYGINSKPVAALNEALQKQKEDIEDLTQKIFFANTQKVKRKRVKVTKVDGDKNKLDFNQLVLSSSNESESFDSEDDTQRGNHSLFAMISKKVANQGIQVVKFAKAKRLPNPSAEEERKNLLLKNEQVKGAIGGQTRESLIENQPSELLSKNQQTGQKDPMMPMTITAATKLYQTEPIAKLEGFAGNLISDSEKKAIKGHSTIPVHPNPKPATTGNTSNFFASLSADLPSLKFPEYGNMFNSKIANVSQKIEQTKNEFANIERNLTSGKIGDSFSNFSGKEPEENKAAVQAKPIPEESKNFGPKADKNPFTAQDSKKMFVNSPAFSFTNDPQNSKLESPLPQKKLINQGGEEKVQPKQPPNSHSISSETSLRLESVVNYSTQLKIEAAFPEITQWPKKSAPAPEVTQKPEVPAPAPEITQKPEVPAPAPEITQKPQVTAPAPEITQKPQVPALVPQIQIFQNQPQTFVSSALTQKDQKQAQNLMQSALTKKDEKQPQSFMQNFLVDAKPNPPPAVKNETIKIKMVNLLNDSFDKTEDNILNMKAQDPFYDKAKHKYDELEKDEIFRQNARKMHEIPLRRRIPRKNRNEEEIESKSEKQLFLPQKVERKPELKAETPIIELQRNTPTTPLTAAPQVVFPNNIQQNERPQLPPELRPKQNEKPQNPPEPKQNEKPQNPPEPKQSEKPQNGFSQKQLAFPVANNAPAQVLPLSSKTESPQNAQKIDKPEVVPLTTQTPVLTTNQSEKEKTGEFSFGNLEAGTPKLPNENPQSSAPDFFAQLNKPKPNFQFTTPQSNFFSQQQNPKPEDQKPQQLQPAPNQFAFKAQVTSPQQQETKPPQPQKSNPFQQNSSFFDSSNSSIKFQTNFDNFVKPADQKKEEAPSNLSFGSNINTKPNPPSSFANPGQSFATAFANNPFTNNSFANKNNPPPVPNQKPAMGSGFGSLGFGANKPQQSMTIVPNVNFSFGTNNSTVNPLQAFSAQNQGNSFLAPQAQNQGFGFSGGQAQNFQFNTQPQAPANQPIFGQQQNQGFSTFAASLNMQQQGAKQGNSFNQIRRTKDT